MNNSFYPLKYDNLALDDFYKEPPFLGGYKSGALVENWFISYL